MESIIFLISLAIIWLIFASLQDLKSREVANWLNFSLIIFALCFRFLYSLFDSDFTFLYNGFYGLTIFFIIGNMFYYGRIFAGGDAKLMIALGTILPFSTDFSTNLNLFALFFLIFLFTGGFYGLIWSFYLPLSNFKKYKREFSKKFVDGKKIFIITTFAAIIFMMLINLDPIFLLLSIFVFLLPYLYLHAKSVDESCLVKEVKPTELVEGDWLFRDVKIGKNLVKAKWSGLSKKEIKEIRKNHKKITIRYGIPFVPVFLISFLILIFFYLSNFHIIEDIFKEFYVVAKSFL